MKINKNFLGVTSVLVALLFMVSLLIKETTNVQSIQRITITDCKDTSAGTIKYYDGVSFSLFGKLPYSDNYTRLPNSARDKVSKEIWNLSKNTAGLSICFQTNSTRIQLRTVLDKNCDIANMSPVASKGFDLYTYEDGTWRFVGISKPTHPIHNDETIISQMKKQNRIYLLNFPLYAGVKSVSIGIDRDAFITTPTVPIISNVHPIVFYGTSITQGASASRPGLTYCALIQRFFNTEVINLGFSGNGKFEKVIAEYIMSINPQIIILDCTPNSDPETIKTNLPETIEYIRGKNSTVPIVLVESLVRDQAKFKESNKNLFGSSEYMFLQNKALKNVYEEKRIHGNMFYIKHQELFDQSKELTIDGTHLNDLGHYEAFIGFKKVIEKILIRKT